MFIRNTTNKDIGSITYGGYEFTIPVGVSAIWDEAGKHFLTHNFKIESKIDGAIPPVLESEENEWDGKSYVQVSRFKIESSRIPVRSQIIRLCEERGIPNDTIKTMERRDADNSEFIELINNLPVPQEIRFPEEKQTKNVKETNNKDSDSTGRKSNNGSISTN